MSQPQAVRWSTNGKGRLSEQPFQTAFARSGCVMRPSESKASKK
ncbi:hypothetical protein ACTHUD_02900 [Neisseria sp. P0016.S002]|nr:hypothetical protein [Neisseria flavescens]